MMLGIGWISALGFFGQACFFTRMMLQWVQSERAKQVVVPRLFWQISLVGAVSVVAYNTIREEPVFVLGGIAQVCIYGRNLLIRGPTSGSALAPVALGLLAFFVWMAWQRPSPGVENQLLVVIGFIGAVLWLGRFVVQWWVSERLGRPTLPALFWWFSLAGVGFQLIYAIAAMDAVMIVGFVFAWIPYVRNLMLLRRSTGPSAP